MKNLLAVKQKPGTKTVTKYKMVLSKGLHYVTKKRLRIFLLLIMGLAVYKTLISLQSAIPEENLTIVILGGGLTRNGEVPLHTQLRLDLAFQLFNQNMKRPLLITLSGGTPHKPNPLNSMGFPIFEATAAARKLIQMGVPADHVMEENFSLDTVGNVRDLMLLNVIFNVIKRDFFLYILTTGLFLTSGSLRTCPFT